MTGIVKEKSDELTLKGASWFRVGLRKFMKRKTAMIGLVIIGIYIFVGAFAPILILHDPVAVSDDALFPPCSEYPFGTDIYGRCVYSRVVYGVRVSLIVGFVAVFIALTVGVAIGLIAGFFGGKIDTMLMRGIDIIMAIPTLLLALAISATLGPSLRNVMWAVGLSTAPEYARVIRSRVLSIKEETYIEAARALGMGDMYIILRHVLPNCLGSLIVLATLQIPSTIIWASSLSFLGMGVQPPTPEWGADLSFNREWLVSGKWWLILFLSLIHISEPTRPY